MDFHCQDDDNANGFCKVFNLGYTSAGPKKPASSVVRFGNTCRFGLRLLPNSSSEHYDSAHQR